MFRVTIYIANLNYIPRKSCLRLDFKIFKYSTQNICFHLSTMETMNHWNNVFIIFKKSAILGSFILVKGPILFQQKQYFIANSVPHKRNNNFDIYNLSHDPFSLFPVVNQFEGVCVYLCACIHITHVNMCKFVF